MNTPSTARRERLTSIGVTIAGIALAVFPVALWVAWTPFVFGAVVAAGIFSAAALLVLLSSQPDRGGIRDAASVDAARTELPADFVAEIHRIFPLTYHHSRGGRAPFPAVMRKLRDLMR